MIASGITELQLRNAAREIGVKAEISRENMKGTRWRVKLYPNREGLKQNEDAKYQREGVSTGYRVNAVCWHGFRDFFRACFRQAPEAKFKTAMETWDGSEDFEAHYVESGYKNVGSMMFPRAAAEVCRCPESGRAV